MEETSCNISELAKDIAINFNNAMANFSIIIEAIEIQDYSMSAVVDALYGTLELFKLLKEPMDVLQTELLKLEK